MFLISSTKLLNSWFGSMCLNFFKKNTQLARASARAPHFVRRNDNFLRRRLLFFRKILNKTV